MKDFLGTQPDAAKIRAMSSPQAADLTTSLVQQIEVASVAQLLRHWQGREKALWSDSPVLYRAILRRLLRTGEPLIAYDVASDALNVFPGDVRIRQMLGLALARSGATESANRVLQRLAEEGYADEETLGPLARTYKDFGLQQRHSRSGNENLRKSRDLYLSGYAATAGYYSGINAATLSLLIGDSETSRRLASSVRDQCLVQPGVTKEEQFWRQATLGEAALLLNNTSEAQDWYCQARELAADHYADLNSAKRNALLVLDHQQRDYEWLKQTLSIPAVAVCVGHMIDTPGRESPRFPISLEAQVKQELRERISRLGIGFGYASAACGSDILFLEALLETARKAVVVLPYSIEEFRKSSVDVVRDGNWNERFDRVLQAADQVIFASSEGLLNPNISLRYCNRYLRGLAQLRGAHLDTAVVGIAVWDSTSDRQPGGTTETVLEWKEIGFPVEIIDIARRKAHTSKEEEMGASANAVVSQVADGEFQAGIRGLLFADAVGFSKLKEHQIPGFVRTFLGNTAELLKSSSHTPIFRNTWGDGMYFVFERISSAGAFALEMREMIRNPETRDPSLPDDMNLRIGLHAGPVYSCHDPIIDRMNYVGTHVSRAARIEPIAPPGEVYASEAFAALAAAEGMLDFACEYVGRTPQAKNYGTFPTYILKNKSKT